METATMTKREAVSAKRPAKRRGASEERTAALMARLEAAIERARPGMDRIGDVDAFLEEFKGGFYD